MADEYIKREAVIELLEEKQRAICPVGRCGHGYVYGRDRDEYDAIESDIDAVQNIPAADVRPVVHARWDNASQISHKGFEWFKCSNCGMEWSNLTNFCPNCGADMREVQGAAV